MPKFNIYVSKKARKKAEAPVRLKLVRESGDIYLASVGSKGRVRGGGYILKLKSNGTLFRCTGCEVTGIKTNKEGQLLIVKD